MMCRLGPARGARARRHALVVAATLVFTVPRPTRADTFEAGSYIVPMDTDYQDEGMLEAFGLVYQLLLNDITVRWVILQGKLHSGVDFVASATDIETGAPVSAHGYRGGPFVIDALDAAAALPIVTDWQATHTTAVHEATESFSGSVSKVMVAAPAIAVYADGNEDIAYDYLNAAGIPDSTGAEWTAQSPDGLTRDALRGSSDEVHDDGALFDADGDPVYCELMSMHWNVSDRDREGGEEVVAEVRSFLQFRTHLFAECQAVNAFENAINGRFLTPNGYVISGDPDPIVYLNSDLPFAQVDGEFATVGGSERSYTLPVGDSYKAVDVVMMTEDTDPLIGDRDLWMTGYVDGACTIGYEGIPCRRSAGKVSYLGGHRYDVHVPMSAHPETQGTRLFLNSLFEADCVVLNAQPDVRVTQTAPALVNVPATTFNFTAENVGFTTARSVVLTDVLPAGTEFVSATGDGAYADGVVTWELGNLGVGEVAMVSLTVSLGAFGQYSNSSTFDYLSGNSARSGSSNTVVVDYVDDADLDGCDADIEAEMGTDPDRADTDDDGTGDCSDVCPLDPNPGQDLQIDPENCGGCGILCSLFDAVAACEEGGCVVAACLDGHFDIDGEPLNGCEYACTLLGPDTTCDEVDDDCDGAPDDEPGACPPPDPDGDAGTDADAGADADSDTDSDSGTDSDADSGTDSDADSGTDSDADSDADSGPAADATPDGNGGSASAEGGCSCGTTAAHPTQPLAALFLFGIALVIRRASKL